MLTKTNDRKTRITITNIKTKYIMKKVHIETYYADKGKFEMCANFNFTKDFTPKARQGRNISRPLNVSGRDIWRCILTRLDYKKINDMAKDGSFVIVSKYSDLHI